MILLLPLQGTIKILHLEDTPSDSDLVDRVLKKSGISFNKFWAENKEAYEKGLREFSPDIVLSDHSVGNFDSAEALSIFKQAGLKIPFVLVTGNISEEYAVEILKEGADDYLLKDNMVRLPNVIKSAIRAKKAQVDKENAFEELSRREEHYFSLIQNSKDLITLIDRTGIITYQSPSINAVLGFSASELIGTSFFDLAHPEDLPLMKERLELRLKGLEPNRNLEYRFRNKAGEWRVFDSSISNLIDNPSVNAIVINSRDVSERKQLENKLLAKIKELDTFIYKASHDLKGPLSSIIGLLNLAKEQRPSGDEMMQYLDMIDTSTRKLDQVLTGLIETMRVKDVTAQAELIDFKTLIDEVLNGLRYSSNFDRIKYDVNINTSKPFYSLTTIIHSVLQNLIENAIKYHKHEQERPFISIAVYDLANGIGIDIQDNGHGMKEEILEKIFDMYYRGNESSKGSGLGLYIVQTAVTRLGGVIKVASVVDQGTKFLIYLPTLQKPGAATAR